MTQMFFRDVRGALGTNSADKLPLILFQGTLAQGATVSIPGLDTSTSGNGTFLARHLGEYNTIIAGWNNTTKVFTAPIFGTNLYTAYRFQGLHPAPPPPALFCRSSAGETTIDSRYSPYEVLASGTLGFTGRSVLSYNFNTSAHDNIVEFYRVTTSATFIIGTPSISGPTFTRPVFSLGANTISWCAIGVRNNGDFGNAGAPIFFIRDPATGRCRFSSAYEYARIKGTFFQSPNVYTGTLVSGRTWRWTSANHSPGDWFNWTSWYEGATGWRANEVYSDAFVTGVLTPTAGENTALNAGAGLGTMTDTWFNASLIVNR